jgi:hypothetical protein
MDNDAKSCYDRIIVNLAMLVSKYFGMSNISCKTQAKILKRMQYRLQTALGDSKHSYAHSETKKLHGTGQGSCASPCLWLKISSILMECLETEGFGMTMEDIEQVKLIHQWIKGFIDDTSLFTNMTDDTGDLEKLRTQLQKDTQCWSDLLHASGGQLELSKCFYYMLAWKFFTEGDPIPLTIDELELPQITIQNPSTGETIEIVQKEVDESHKTLGVYKTIIGKEKNHMSYLQETNDAYAMKAATARLSRRQARVAYSSMLYMPAMLYSLTAMGYSDQALTTLQCKAVDKFLPAMGFERSFPRAVVYGPQLYGGLNIGHLYTDRVLHSQDFFSLGSHMQQQPTGKDDGMQS